jgi:energy-converting hydrogenase Eha subunit E
MIAPSATTFLAPWANFYTMAGSSAAALTGLMFVVITLVRRSEIRDSAGIDTFSTPTVVHFSTALFLSAALNAPWHLLIHPAILTGLVGLFGIIYNMRVMRRTKSLTTYTPDIEDWTWYSIVPLLTYIVILGAAIATPSVPVQALFVVAGCVVALIFLGIRNAWDVVTFIAVRGINQD